MTESLKVVKSAQLLKLGPVDPMTEIGTKPNDLDHNTHPR